MENNNKLAKISLAINAVLIILIIVCFTKISALTTEPVTVDIDDTTASQEVFSEPTGKIGFFNLDSLNSQLSLFKEIEQEMQNSAKEAEQKMKNKQAEINSWEKKWADRAPLMSSEQDQYMKEAQDMQNNAMEFEQNVQMKMQQEQSQLMETYAVRISNQSKAFANLNGYDAIMAYTFGQSIWYYNPALDVTNEFAKVMNADYAASTGESTDETKEK